MIMRYYYILTTLLLVSISYIITYDNNVNNSNNYSIVMTMIIRDEEINLKSNLALWLPIVKYFVFLIDTRTVDNSAIVIKSILDKSSANYVILPNDFDGFGKSRTRSLESAWKYYSNATHVWISDPDWKPDIKTMNINDLDLNHDVFSFLCYDRTGITTRNMHWILKHKQGLKMRYNLHEVLDIGKYTWKDTNWITYEIEKPGSWHTTVGHGHSMSKERYLFDLNLLYKDLEEYGHDSHTHYYLAITHEALATKIITQKNSTTDDNFVYHLESSIKYLNIRIKSYYEDEYLHDKWGCMLLLGNIESYYKDNFILAEYWYTLCYEYDKKIADCGILLLYLYTKYNKLEKSYKLLNQLLTVEKSLNYGISHYKSWDCDLPNAAITVLENKLLFDKHILMEEVKYMLLLRHLLSDKPICNKLDPIKKTISVLATKILQGSSIDILSNKEKICNDIKLQQYIHSNNIKIHPCNHLIDMVHKANKCKSFYNEMPLINEEHQITLHKQFIGGLNIYDLVHHVYNGNINKVFFDHSRPFRVLFAEYFNIQLFYQLVNFILKNPSIAMNITILLSPYNGLTYESIAQDLFNCQIKLPNEFSVQYIYVTSLTSYLMSISIDTVYDYVEYNGGMFQGLEYEQHLNVLLTHLSIPYGTIGLSYFSKNKYQNDIYDIITNHLKSSNLTSKNAINTFNNHYYLLIEKYLSYYNIDILLSDDQFRKFYLIDNKNIYSNITRDDDVKLGNVFSQDEIVDIVSARGYQVQSWFPKAISRPFDELEFSDIKLFAALGMSQSDFVKNMLPSFRYTIYLTNKQHSNIISRASILSLQQSTNTTSSNKYVDIENVIVIDRIGILNNKAILSLINNNQSIEIILSYYTINNQKQTLLHLPYLIDSQLVPLLPYLPAQLSIGQLVNKIVDSKNNNNYKVILVKLLQLLDYFERINYITFQYNTSINNIIAKVSGSSNYFNDIQPNLTTDSTVDLSIKKIQHMRNLGFPDSVINGLINDNITNRNELKSFVNNNNNNVNNNNSNNIRDESVLLDEDNYIYESILLDKVNKMKKLGFTKQFIDDMVDKHKSNRLKVIIDASENKKDKNIDSSIVNEINNTTDPSSVNIENEHIISNITALDVINKINLNSNLSNTSTVDILKKLLIDKLLSSDLSSNYPFANDLSDHIYDRVYNRSISRLTNHRQTKQQLMDSYRSTYCIAPNENDKINKCRILKYLKRKTAAIDYFNIAKLNFDIKQLSFILLSDDNYNSFINNAIVKLTTIRDYLVSQLSNNQTAASNKLIKHLKLNFNDSYSYINHVIYIPTTSSEIRTKLCYPKALIQIYNAMKYLHSNDYIVIDDLIQKANLIYLTDLLLKSTIWFDLTNGLVFGSYLDDGLIYDEFNYLANEIASAASNNDLHMDYTVKSYFVLAFDLSQCQIISPTIIGLDNEIIGLLWLNHRSIDLVTTNGLYIYESTITTSLYKSGISIYPSIHPNFVSYNNNLTIDIKNSNFEVITSESNRLVLINNNIPFNFKYDLKEDNCKNLNLLDDSVSYVFIVTLQTS